MLSALTGQTKCKQTQLVGCKFDENTRTDKMPVPGTKKLQSVYFDKNNFLSLKIVAKKERKTIFFSFYDSFD
jgi:hypothetical protein